MESRIHIECVVRFVARLDFYYSRLYNLNGGIKVTMIPTTRFLLLKTAKLLVLFTFVAHLKLLD